MTKLMRSCGVEVVFVFMVIMAMIWLLPGGSSVYGPWHAIGGFAIIFFIFASWKVRGDGLKTLGLLPDDYGQAGLISLFCLMSVAVLVAVGLIINPKFYDKPNFWDDVIRQLRFYFGWALCQQLLLQGYFTNRIHQWLGRIWPSALTAGILFGVAHLPNPVLAPATFIMGTAFAYFFLKSRNLFILAAAHSVLGTVVKYTITAQLLSNGMRVGPGYWG